MSTDITRPMSLRDIALLLVLAFLWGGSFLFNKIAVAEMPPLVLVFGRVLLAALALAGAILALGQRLPRGATLWTAFFGMGVLNNVIPFSLIVWGQQFVPAGVAAILNASTPFFAVLSAHWLSSDRATPAKMAGVLIGFAGVMVLIGPGVLWHNENIWPLLSFVGAALSYGLSGVYGKRIPRMGATPLQAAFGQLTASSVIMLPMMLLAHGAFWQTSYSPQTLVSLIMLALFCTAIAYMIFFSLLASTGPTNLSLVTMLVPVSAILLGVVVLGETLAARHFFGMVAIMAGLVVIDGRIFKRVRPAL
ncbi:MAG: DMT family transporter [Beijerinckiaceae bacterium]